MNEKIQKIFNYCYNSITVGDQKNWDYSTVDANVLEKFEHYIEYYSYDYIKLAYLDLIKEHQSSKFSYFIKTPENFLFFFELSRRIGDTVMPYIKSIEAKFATRLVDYLSNETDDNIKKYLAMNKIEVKDEFYWLNLDPNTKITTKLRFSSFGTLKQVYKRVLSDDKKPEIANYMFNGLNKDNYKIFGEVLDCLVKFRNIIAHNGSILCTDIHYYLNNASIKQVCKVFNIEFNIDTDSSFALMLKLVNCLISTDIQKDVDESIAEKFQHLEEKSKNPNNSSWNIDDSSTYLKKLRQIGITKYMFIKGV